MSDAAKMKLDRAKAGLMVIDVQERLSAVMQPEGLDWIVSNIGILMQGAKVMDLPIIITEQYPRGLGATVPKISALVMKGHAPIDKVEFLHGQRKGPKAVADSARNGSPLMIARLRLQTARHGRAGDVRRLTLCHSRDQLRSASG